MKAPVQLKNKSQKVQFLLGIRNGTRSIHELIDLETVFTDPEKFEKACNNSRYEGKTIFFLPDNHRPRINNCLE